MQKNIFLTLVSLYAIGLCLAAPVSAETTGCCKSTSSSGQGVNYTNELAKDCKGTNKAFVPDAKVGPDGFSCVPDAPAPSSLQKKASLPDFNAPVLGVSIPGFSPLQKITCLEGNECSIPWIGQYINGLQRYGLGIVGILAAIMLMIGGLMWLTAGGNNEQVGKAQTIIKSAIVGLILAFSGYFILNFINPNLTQLENLKISRIKEINLDQVLAQIKDGAPITKEQAELMAKFDKDGVINHTVGSKATGYKALSCDKSIFSGGKAVDFFTTGYYKPTYANTQDFFCAIGLNCSCPAGVKKMPANKAICGHNSEYCAPFPASTPYCTANASGKVPAIGQIAADSCFSFGDQVCIGGKITLTVADRGKEIKGRRFDIYTGMDQKAALGKTGVVSVTLGPCK